MSLRLFCRPSDIVARQIDGIASRRTRFSIKAFTPGLLRIIGYKRQCASERIRRTVRPLSRNVKVQNEVAFHWGGQRAGHRKERLLAGRRTHRQRSQRTPGAAGGYLIARFAPNVAFEARRGHSPATDIRDQAKRMVILRSTSQFTPRRIRAKLRSRSFLEQRGSGSAPGDQKGPG